MNLTRAHLRKIIKEEYEALSSSGHMNDIQESRLRSLIREMITHQVNDIFFFGPPESPSERRILGDLDPEYHDEVDLQGVMNDPSTPRSKGVQDLITNWERAPQRTTIYQIIIDPPAPTPDPSSPPLPYDPDEDPDPEDVDFHKGIFTYALATEANKWLER